MTAPLYAVAPALTAIPVGIAFGVALEQSGLGVPRTIAAQLAGRDFTVMKVMFSAIATAMLGLYWASRFGWLDTSALALPPTDIIPQTAGAVLFGIGFAIASLCPGTACVAAGTGRRDGLAVIGGLFVGTLLTMALWPQLGQFAQENLRENVTLPASLGMSTGVTVALLTAVAVVAIRIGVWFESRTGTRRAPSWGIGRSAAALASLLAIIAATGSGGRADTDALQIIAREISNETDHVDPLQLAQWIHDGKPGLRVIDVREADSTDDYLIPSAESVPLAEIPTLDIARGETAVLYSNGGAHAAQAWVLMRLRGFTNVLVLRDGLAGWEEGVLSPIIPPATDTVATRDFVRVRGLSLYFGGKPVIGNAAGGAVPTRKHRAGTC